MASAESIIYGALQALAGGRVYPDLAPAPATAPWLTYTAVGGQAFPTVDGEAPALRNARVQVSVFAKSRAEAVAIMEQAFTALVNPAVKAVPIGAPISTFEDDTLLYSSSLDFSITFRIA